MIYLGIDLGTSAVKLLIMDHNGEVVNELSNTYPLMFPQEGWSEQDPNLWWEAVKEGIKELTNSVDEKISGISFSGQMHGLVVLDDKDEVIRPAILWNDQRTEKQCEALNNLGRKFLSDHTANIALTGFTAPKILWMKENEEELFNKINKIMLPKDFIAYKLTGVHASDVSDASGTLLFDVKNKKWSKEMMDILSINEKLLPTVYESYEVIGTVKPEIVVELGLSSTTKVVIGGGDQAVAAVGTGTVASNKCSISLGTSGVVFVSSDKFAVDDNNALHAFCHANGKYHLMGVMLSAAASLKWWQEGILSTLDYTKEQENINNLGENSVCFLPYLMGERTPHNDPNARGVFAGMTLDTKREEMTQAVMEGVAFALRDSFEIIRSLGLDIESVRINGGGAKSLLWRKIVANTLNVKVETINTEQGPAYGAAILAAVGDGLFDNVEEATKKFIKVINTVEPNDETVNKYNNKYPHFVELYKALKPYFSK